MKSNFFLLYVKTLIFTYFSNIFMGVTNFTFTLEKTLKNKMKTHKEINWSEIFRNAAEAKINELDKYKHNIVDINEIAANLPKELLEYFSSDPNDTDVEEFKKLKKLEERRMNNLKLLEFEE